MKFKFKRKTVFLICAAVVTAVLIIISALNRGSVNVVENGVGIITRPFSGIFMKIKDSISQTGSAISNIKNLRKENSELKEKLVRLEDENRKLNDVVARAEYLKEEYELLKAKKHDYIKAYIINKDPGSRFNRFVVDKGRKDGISAGNNVVLGRFTDDGVIVEGLVGRVFEVGENWAKVMSVIDEANSISFKNIRTQDGGVMNGFSDGLLKGYLFDNKADIIKDDKLFTSGLGEGYVKDLYIGNVKNVLDSEQNLTKEIEVEPIVNFKKITDVFIIKNSGEIHE